MSCDVCSDECSVSTALCPTCDTWKTADRMDMLLNRARRVSPNVVSNTARPHLSDPCKKAISDLERRKKLLFECATTKTMYQWRKSDKEGHLKGKAGLELSVMEAEDQVTLNEKTLKLAWKEAAEQKLGMIKTACEGPWVEDSMKLVGICKENLQKARHHLNDVRASLASVSDKLRYVEHELRSGQETLRRAEQALREMPSLETLQERVDRMADLKSYLGL